MGSNDGKRQIVRRRQSKEVSLPALALLVDKLSEGLTAEREWRYEAVGKIKELEQQAATLTRCMESIHDACDLVASSVNSYTGKESIATLVNTIRQESGSTQTVAARTLFSRLSQEAMASGGTIHWQDELSEMDDGSEDIIDDIIDQR